MKKIIKILFFALFLFVFLGCNFYETFKNSNAANQSSEEQSNDETTWIMKSDTIIIDGRTFETNGSVTFNNTKREYTLKTTCKNYYGNYKLTETGTYTKSSNSVLDLEPTGDDSPNNYEKINHQCTLDLEKGTLEMTDVPFEARGIRKSRNYVNFVRNSDLGRNL